MTSLSDPLDAPGTEGETVCIDDLPGPDTVFVESYVREERSNPLPQRLPRSWVEVEAIVELRVAQFEERHSRECTQQFELGVQEGFRRHEATLQDKLADAAGPIEKVVSRLDSDIKLYQEQIYSQSVALASAMAAQWVGDLVSMNEHVFLSAMRDALEPLRHLDRVTIRLHPEDYEALKEGLQEGDASCARFGSVAVVSDSSVDRGGAISTSEGGSVDARLETRVERAKELVRMDTHGR